MKKLSLIFLFLLVVSSLSAQTRQLKGTINDANGEPLVGATIKETGTNTTTVSNVNGSFIISLSPNAKTVEVSYISYKPQTFNVQGKNEIQVVLEEDQTYLDEVIVVGYGKQKRVSLTGSVSALTGEEITRRNAPNLSSALQGLMPGVTVVQPSGRPGADGGEISIRGKGSMKSSTSPLVLIDGVEGDMNALDMNAVESISVLKDASAAIYGSRSSNGVILVTTKRGAKSGVKISYSNYFGVTQPTEMPEPITGVEFMQYMNQANRNSGGTTDMFDQHRIDEYEKYGADNWYNFDTDWKKQMLKNYSTTNKHTLSISGGSERINYFVSGSYQYQGGLIDNNDFNRKTLRVNTDMKITSWATLGLDLNIRDNQETTPSQTTPENLIGQALTYSPILAGINSDGTWGEGLNGYNPIAILRNGGERGYEVAETSARGSLVLTPFKGFEASALYSVKLQNDYSSTFIRPYNVYVQGINKYSYPTGSSANGRADEWWKKNVQSQFNAQASYEMKVRKDHELKILGGMQVELLDTKSLNGTRYGFYVPGYEEMGLGTENPNTGTGHSQWAMVSYYGKFNYSYKDKILLDLTGRYEGSSRFINDRWALFPGGSLAWRISEEGFYKPIKSIVNEMKIRTSYGEFGNQWLNDYYPYSAPIAVANYHGYFFNDVQSLGAIQKKLHNRDISWEVSKQANVGIDLAFLKNRLFVNLDVYQKRITQMILEPTVPKFVGFDAAYFNVGAMKNQGVDFQVVWRDKVGGLKYNVTGTFSDAKSTIEELSTLTESGGLNAMKVGSLLSAVRGWETEGFYKNQADIDISPSMIEKVNVKPGDIKYRDKNGDGVIDNGDLVLLGDGNPRYEYSLNILLEWKEFDFSFFTQGVGERAKRYNGNGIIPFNMGRSMYKSQLDFWTEDNQNAQFPRLSLNNSNNYYASDFWIKNAAYLRIKNVVLGYSIPKNILEKIKLEHVRFYVSGQNLFTFSNTFEGFDPEGNNNYDSSFYPIMRVYTVGLDIRF